MKTVAIMQPYLFPYLGYFQLVNLVDTFILYDDVNFIKKGWIHRNKIIGKSEPYSFTVPIKDASQNKLIKDTLIHENYESWKLKFLTTLLHSYTKAPNFLKINQLIISILDSCTSNDSISQLCLNSIKEINKYLEIKTKIIDSSSIYDNQNLKAENRIIDICKEEKATRYVNPINGQQLYTKENFEKENIELRFHRILDHHYQQFDQAFQSYLSIIDILMFCQPCEIQNLLQQYALL